MLRIKQKSYQLLITLTRRNSSTAAPIAIQRDIEFDNETPSKAFKNAKIENTANSSEANRLRIAWKDAKPLESMPGPKAFPILGNTWRFVVGEFKGLDAVDLYASLHKKFGPIVRLTNIIGLQDAVVLFDPDDVREMYRNEDGTWPRREMLHVISHYRKVMHPEIFQDVYGLPVSQGEEWFKLRSAVNPILLKPRISEEFIPKIETAARGFIKRVENLAAQNPLMPDNFMDEVNKYTLESISYVALNRRFGLLSDELTAETKKLITSTIRVFDLIYELDFKPSLWKFIPTPKWREYIRHMDFLTGIYMNVIDQEMKRLMDTTHFETEEDKCILQKFLAIDKRVAVTVVFDSLAAGVDTTSKTIGAMIYLLAKHKRVQKKLRKELLEVFPDENTPITPALLDKCKYLKAVIKECSRVHGVAVAQLRNVGKDMVLGGYQIPNGTYVMGAQCTMVKSDQYIPRANEFIPERFLREHNDDVFSMSKVNKHIYLPFGFGPRSCVGKRIANLELEISLALLMRKFRLDWQQPNMKFRATIMYGLADPLKVHVHLVDPELERASLEKEEDLNRLDYTPELE